MRWTRLLAALAATLCACARPTRSPTIAPIERALASERPRFEPFTLRSERLSLFAGRDVTFEAMVLTPANYDPACGGPALYFLHGFGSSALRTGAGYTGDVLARDEAGVAPPLIRVFLDANHPLGHHVFADSANTGPWSTALVEELLPAIEARYGALPEPSARFLGGHSSGGWASLWLQIDHPETFGGVWSLAPDPVDFHSFTNVDLYGDDNMYRAPDGDAVPLVREGAKVVTTLETFVRADPEGRRIYASFDAVFSPRGPGGPVPLFDRETGRIDRAVVRSWEQYDIAARLRREWPTLGPRLGDKLHVIVGLEDTYYLEAPVRLLAQALAQLGGRADIVFVPGRAHVDLFDPHPELYPGGLLKRIEDEMWTNFRATHPRPRCP
ncbi:alpha/beta hydrolase [Nannocystis punicea]|uniref:Alpha/beta hydrolase n=1 Tax=Nannocystis punicea TaxID=2995304 RepID=A0ABY7GUR0_9BACT|nr:alpha/beta hydrolase [Nannocystis poenicansa]WAS90705.1 alpha/beta hydrolase [Nannocystis poenicansa]